MSRLLQLFYFPSPNGRKISIALEEMCIPYELKLVNIFEHEAQTPEFLRISPNARIPAIVDWTEGGEEVAVFESGAILQYLGRKSGQLYTTQDEVQRTRIDAWVFWQMAHLGPTSGQITWFKRAARKEGRDEKETSLAIYRNTKELKRLYAVLEQRLQGRDYICDDYSIADIASWTWVNQYHYYAGDITSFPAIDAWHSRIAQRPAVKRAMELGVAEFSHLAMPRG